MNSSKRSKIIKSENVILVDQGKAARAQFVRAKYESTDEDGLPAEEKMTSAEKTRREMREKIAQVKDESYKAGYDRGYKEGVEKQKKEALKLVQTVTELVKEIGVYKKGIMEKAEGEMLDLAFGIAEKVVHQEITTNRDVIQSVMKDAIKSIVDKDGLKIRLNPADFNYMMEIKTDFLQSIDGIKNVVFEEDAGIRQGGVVVESLFGEVDARIDKQFKEVRHRLTGEKI